MKKIISFLAALTGILIIIFTNDNSESAGRVMSEILLNDTESCKFFPLNKGNTFYYKRVRSTDTILFSTVITDTISHNGKKYYHIINFPYNANQGVELWTYDVRYDSSNGQLKNYSETAVNCNYELKLFKLAAILNDTMGINYCLNFTPPGPTGSVVIFRCNSTGIMNIFNYAVDYKSFLNLTNYTQFNWSSNTTFAKNFGMSYLSSSFSSHAGSSVTYYYLLGAKIKGVMYGDSTLTGLKIISNEIPEIYSLSQNYPNPFNPSTKIEIKIPSREAEGSPWREYGVSRGVGLVTLQVYDITGRLIKTLIKQELQPGTYEVTFDGSGLNSGVYFYQMRTGNFTEIKKMILVK